MPSLLCSLSLSVFCRAARKIKTITHAFNFPLRDTVSLADSELVLPYLKLAVPTLLPFERIDYKHLIGPDHGNGTG